MQDDWGMGGQMLPSGFKTDAPDQLRPSRRAKKADTEEMRLRRQRQEQRRAKRRAWAMMQATARRKHAASRRDVTRRRGERRKRNSSAMSEAAAAAASTGMLGTGSCMAGDVACEAGGCSERGDDRGRLAKGLSGKKRCNYLSAAWTH